MPLVAIETERVYRQIAAQLSALIASGELPPGARIPSERDLAKRMGASRPSVRQALIVLELEGKIVIEVGVGVFVAQPPPVTMVERVGDDVDARTLLLPRWLIESEIAMEATRHATEGDLRGIAATVDEMERCREEKRDAEACDRRFHLGIAEATHNGALVLVAHNLWEQCRSGVRKQGAAELQTPEHQLAVLRDHRAILAALQARDPRRTRAAMRRHLKRVERDLRLNWRRATQAARGQAEKACA